MVRPIAQKPPSKAEEPKLTKNQQTMFSLLRGAGAAGLTTEQWNEQGRAVEIGIKRKADLYDIRVALKSKGLVRQYGDRWNVCLITPSLFFGGSIVTVHIGYFAVGYFNRTAGKSAATE